MNLKGKKVCVIGYGIAGKSAVELLLNQGAEVFVSEISKMDIRNERITFEIGEHSEKILDCELIVKSPGVTPHNSMIKKAIAKGIKVIDEIELAYYFLKCKKLIAVTGTNGKSTTVKLLGEIFGNANLDFVVCGNIGEPISSVVDKINENTYVIAEVSSYQLKFIEKFKPDISCILNITKDHFDQHPDFSDYVNSKANIFMNQFKDDFCVLNFDNPTTRQLAEKVKSKVIFFSKRKLSDGVWMDNNRVNISIDGKYDSFPLFTNLLGAHNIENILASVAISYICGINVAEISEAIKLFKGLEHRIEFVREINGVKFINDSKSTNPDSLKVALEVFPGDVHLIMGGKDKGFSYVELKELIKNKVKKIYSIGELTEKIHQELMDVVEVCMCYELEKAVKEAFRNSRIGDCILLSPGTSSFDQFRNFEERGEKFREIVFKL